jgi:formylglycine-generating enzyme required for sulfatase activity
MSPEMSPGALPPLRRAIVWRGDLLRLAAADGPIALTRFARLLGLLQDSTEEEPQTSGAGAEKNRGGEGHVPDVTDPLDLPFLATNDQWPWLRRQATVWRPVQFSGIAAVDSPAAQKGQLKWNQPPQEVLHGRKLQEWRRLEPRLRSALQLHESAGDLDVPRTIERLARGITDRPFPRRGRRGWRPPIQLILDWSRRLTPYRSDRDYVRARLRHLLGNTNIEAFYGTAPDPNGLNRCWDVVSRGGVYRWPAAGTHVIVVGDLGCLDRDDSDRWTAAWQRFGRELVNRGAIPIALVPCDPARIPRQLTRLYRVIGWSGNGRGASSVKDRAAMASRLMSLLSYCVWFEWGMLRAMRQAFSWAADPGLEADIWQHPFAVRKSLEAGFLATGADVDAMIEKFEAEPDAVREKVLSIWRSWRIRLGCEVYFEELARLRPETRALLGIADWEDTKRAWQYFLDRVSNPHGSSDGRSRETVQKYLRKMVARASSRVAMDADIGPLYMKLREHFGHTDRGHDTPDQIAVFLCGDQLMLRGEMRGAAEPIPTPAWSRVVTLRTRTGFVELLAAERETAAVEDFGGKPSHSTSLPIDKGELERSGRTDTGDNDRNGSEGQQATKPSLASRFEIVAGVPRSVAIPKAETLLIRTDSDEYRLQKYARPQGGLAKGRDRQLGRDKFGVWLVSDLAGVKTRWRWIPPGGFLMGSPESEPGRYDDEGPRHWVRITRGFWMLSTPCTQALWEAVMGSKANRSRFKDPARPVENVSWNDAMEFLEKLNKDVPGCGFGLPTEAQWEYACRAGSAEALYRVPGETGQIEILGENNAPALDAIAWYGGNSGVDYDLTEAHDSSDWPAKQYQHQQAGTRKVASKLPNAWGLYDMLGNVLEWCADGQRDYSKGPEDDLSGRTDDNIGSRCVRGGGWSDLARDVRCAIRLQVESEDRDELLGFRLVRVQDGS